MVSCCLPQMPHSGVLASRCHGTHHVDRCRNYSLLGNIIHNRSHFKRPFHLHSLTVPDHVWVSAPKQTHAHVPSNVKRGCYARRTETIREWGSLSVFQKAQFRTYGSIMYSSGKCTQNLNSVRSSLLLSASKNECIHQAVTRGCSAWGLPHKMQCQITVWRWTSLYWPTDSRVRGNPPRVTGQKSALCWLW